ncbi:MAG: RNA polymerase sigma factor [Polyangiales bacterium]
MSCARVEHFFRHEYGRLVASLTRRVGHPHLELVEDAVQTAMMRAVETWPRRGEPDDASAWLYRVAYREIAGRLRRTPEAAAREESTAPPEASFENEVQDDLLRMLFVCCDEGLPPEAQIVLALRTLCGFSVAEIAQRLFLTEANVYKRLLRARERLRKIRTDPLAGGAGRLHSVLRVLYLLFTEAHLSLQAGPAIRDELGRDALRLALVVARHPRGKGPRSAALVALMHFHLARSPGRQAMGQLLLLEEQERHAWDRQAIAIGLEWLALSAAGDDFSRYHAEAGVAAEHCMAPSYAETRWDRVVSCYETLEKFSPSPLHRLNRAIAMAEWKGPKAGLDLLESFEPKKVTDSFYWTAALSDLCERAGRHREAQEHRRVALSLAPSEAIRRLFLRRNASLKTMA